MAGKQVVLSSWKPSPAPARKFKRKNLQELLQTSEFIYQIGECDGLRQKSQNVPIREISSEEMKKKITYLKKCLLQFRKITGKGKGIAAVQVGIPERFFIIYDEDKKEKCRVIINPVIVKKAQKKYRYAEQCMSCNGLVASVVRPSWVEFFYYDEAGKKRYWEKKEDTEKGKIENRVMLHEIDHLNGIINIDRVQSKDLLFTSDPKIHETAKFEKA